MVYQPIYDAGGGVWRPAEAGITFALDDFGNGSSSLGRSHLLPLPTVKISRTFLHKIEEHAETPHLVKGMLKRSEALSLRTVAVGGERPEQYTLLRELGCDLFQDFLLARPMPPSAVTALPAENRRVLSVAS